MSACCASCQRTDRPLHRSTHLQLLFCNAECRDTYICKTHRYPPHATDEQYVVVPMRSEVADAYRRWPVLLETGKSSLAHCRHPNAMKNAYVLQRHIVEPIAAFIQQIGPKRKTEEEGGRPKRASDYPAEEQDEPEESTSLTSAASTTASTYTPLPSTPATTAEPLSFLELPPEILSGIFARLRAKDWAHLFQTNVALRNYLAGDPVAFAKALSTMPAGRVRNAAHHFIKESDEQDYALGIMDGFARRFATAINGSKKMRNLCAVAIRRNKPRLLRVLLIISPERGSAIVDLRESGALDPYALIDILHSADLLRIVMDWRIGEREERATTTYNELLNTMYRFAHKDAESSFSQAAIDLIVDLIMRYDSPYKWVKTLVRFTAAPFMTELRTTLLNRVDLNSMIVRIATKRHMYKLSPTSLIFLGAWRGSRGEYVDFAQVIAAFLSAHTSSAFTSDFRGRRFRSLFMKPKAEVNAQLLVPYIAFYLRWRSPESSPRYIDLRNRRTLELMLTSLTWDLFAPFTAYDRAQHIGEHAPVLYDSIMTWRVPTEYQHEAQQTVSIVDLTLAFFSPTVTTSLDLSGYAAFLSALSTRLVHQPHGAETLQSEADCMSVAVRILDNLRPQDWIGIGYTKSAHAVIEFINAPLRITTVKGTYATFRDWITRDRGITLFETGLHSFHTAIVGWFDDKASAMDYCGLVLLSIADQRQLPPLHFHMLAGILAYLSVPYTPPATSYIVINDRRRYAQILFAHANRTRRERGEPALAEPDMS